jgi:hypothetical protein
MISLLGTASDDCGCFAQAQDLNVFGVSFASVLAKMSHARIYRDACLVLCKPFFLNPCVFAVV